MGRCAAIAMRVEFVQSNVKLLNDRVLQSTSNRLQYKAGNFTLLVRVHAKFIFHVLNQIVQDFFRCKKNYFRGICFANPLRYSTDLAIFVFPASFLVSLQPARPDAGHGRQRYSGGQGRQR